MISLTNNGHFIYELIISLFMTNNFAILCCSGADFDKAFQEKYDIRLIPTRIMVNDEEYIDRVNITREELINKLLHEKAKTSTSVAPPFDYMTIFQKALEDYEEALCVTISSKMSATYERSLHTVKRMKTDKITCFDSQSVSCGETMFLEHAARRRKSGLTLDEVVSELEQIREKTKIFFFVNTLDYLIRGGRIGKAKGLIGKLINAKPLLTVKDGEIEPYETFKGTEEDGVDRIVEIVEEEAVKMKNIAVYSVYGMQNDYYDKKIAEMIEKINPIFHSHQPIGPTMISHVGPLVQGIIITEIPERAIGEYLEKRH